MPTPAKAQLFKGHHLVPDSRFSSVMETASDAIITADSRGIILTWNKAAAKIFGYAAAEVIGQPLTIIIPKEHRAAHDRGIARVSAGGEQHVIGKTVELTALRKDGSSFPIELSLSTWMEAKERFYTGIIRDISERKTAEALKQATDLQFRSITEMANDVVIVADQRGTIQLWNAAAQRVFGYTEAEVMGAPLTIIIPEEYKTAHEKGIERVTSGGAHHVIGKTVEVTGLHKDGRRIPIELSLSTWMHGSKRFYAGMIRDISERKMAEAMRQAIDLKFRSVTETANDAIIVANEDGTINLWNGAAQKIFGYKEEEAIGAPLTMIIPEHYRAKHEKGLSRVAKGGEQKLIGHTVEVEGLRKNGTTLPIELSLSTWTFMNKRYFCGIVRDITERKKQEDQLRVQQTTLKQRAKELKKLYTEIRSKNEQLQALSNKLAKYLSRQVYNSIFEGKRDVKIESYRKKLTVFFSDIHGFTELTDRVESEVLTSVLNKYLNEMSKIAIDHGGTIDKYIGDAIMIFFGDPETLGEKQDAIACVKMALDMRYKLTELRREWDVLGISTPLQIRTGINTGFCTVGNFGSEERMDYTIVGGPVNLASRLESLAPIDEILISEDTWNLVKEVVDCEKASAVKVKGLAYPVQTYVVKGLIGETRKKVVELKADMKGFNLSINFKELDYADKLYAKQVLENALAKL